MTNKTTRNTAEADALMRFLRAADERMDRHSNRIPFDSVTGKTVTAWLRDLVGDLNDDGTRGGLFVATSREGDR